MSEREFKGPAPGAPDPYHGWPGPDPYAVQKDRRSDRERQQQPLIETAADLCRMTFPPIGYIVPGYIAEGCTLLAGRPKLGKSWLVLDSGLAVAMGGTCLGGIACEQGDVLYLALEDNRRRLQRRIDKLLGPLNPDWPSAFHYATEWPRANEGGLAKIREWITSKENPRLVVVDVLAMFKPVRGSSESLYEADYGAIKGLQGLAGEFGIAIVVVHHTRKSGVENDPFEKVSGTLGLSGAADTTLILDRDGNGATLYGRGRDIEEIETAVIFDKPGCRWHVQGEAAEVRRTDERGAVLAALEDADEPMSPGDLAVATGHSRNAIDQLLYKMAKACEVVKAARGRYVHPSRFDLIQSAARTPHKNDKKIRNTSDTEGDGTDDGDDFLIEAAGRVRNEGSAMRCGDRSEAAAQSADPDASYLLTDLTGGVETAGSDPAPTDVATSGNPETQANPVDEITKPAAIPLSIPAKDLLVWLQSRSDQPVDAKLITSHAPRHTRLPELRGLILPHLEKRGLVRIEVRTKPGAKPSRFIHLVEGG